MLGMSLSARDQQTFNNANEASSPRRTRDWQAIEPDRRAAQDEIALVA
jgi:hypothetical protein